MLSLFNTLFPARCILCERNFIFSNQNIVCMECILSFSEEKVTYCRSCGKKVLNCQDCLKKRIFRDIKVFRSADENLIKMISYYKLHGIKSLATDIASIFENDIKDFCEENKIDLITYVPLHKKLQKKRGFNHLYEVLKHILPEGVIFELVEKVRETPLQMKLNAEERSKNLKSAFRIKDKDLIKGKNILVFDDIMTTGSTLVEINKELKKGKPENIYGYVIGR